MCAARGRRHAGVYARVAWVGGWVGGGGGGCGVSLGGSSRRTVCAARGVCPPMRVLPRFRSSVVWAARLTRHPQEWRGAGLLAGFSQRSHPVRQRCERGWRARCLWAVVQEEAGAGRGQGRGEAGAGRGERQRAPQPMASLAELRISSSAQLGSVLSSALAPPVVRLRPRDGSALLDTAPRCSAVAYKLSSACSLLSSRVCVLSPWPPASSPRALAALYSKPSATRPDFVLTSNSYPLIPPHIPTHLHPALTTHCPPPCCHLHSFARNSQTIMVWSMDPEKKELPGPCSTISKHVCTWLRKRPCW
jgi:hypothetical protein